MTYICAPIFVTLPTDNGVTVEFSPSLAPVVPIPSGPKGIPGPQGPKGDTGPGVPPGGSAGQYLRKASSTDYDGEWSDLPAPPVTSVNDKAGAVGLDAEDVGALPDTTPLFSGDYDDLTNKPSIPSPQTSGTPADLGTAARGSATTYSRSDHVHKMPTASDVGALPSGTTASDIGALPNTTTAADINGMSKWVKLWENASPTSDFAAQNITLPSNDCDFYYIRVIRDERAPSEIISPIFIGVGEKGFVRFMGGTLSVQDGSIIAYAREITMTSATQVSIADCVLFGAASGTRNDLAIPFQIYGIKGVQ